MRNPLEKKTIPGQTIPSVLKAPNLLNVEESPREIVLDKQSIIRLKAASERRV